VSIMKQHAQQAKAATALLFKASETNRNDALKAIANSLINDKHQILEANKLDLEEANRSQLSSAMADRLRLTGERIKAIANSVLEIAAQPPVIGEIISTHTRDDGLTIKKQRIPLGTIGMIFESRPNVVIDCSALAIKSGNAIILKGGKEAANTNQQLGELVKSAIAPHIPAESVQIADSCDRNGVATMLTLNEYIDLIIPRGGMSLIDFVSKNSRIPVISHYKGVCHAFVNQDAPADMAQNIIVNSKVQRPGVCNALETLLIHQDWPQDHIIELLTKLNDLGVEIRGDQQVGDLFSKAIPAKEMDWDEEYLDLILSVKIVATLEDAINHIRIYGSNHTETIITTSDTASLSFQQQVDASCIMVNASTRFNDGGQLGLGAELGISTSKLHAYGPMGAREMTAVRFLVEGEGHIRK